MGMRDQYGNYFTGIAPPEAVRSDRRVTEKDKVELWFIEPLENMKGDEAFICLMICFPLLETIMRLELGIPDKDDVKFSDNAEVLHWFAKFMTIPDQSARDVWDAFRNGLLHRSMIKGSMQYELTGKEMGRPAEFKDGILTIFVWDLRNAVVEKLREHHRKLWKQATAALPAIYLKA